MNSTLRSLVFWMVLVVVVVLVWNVSTQFQAADDSVTFSDFLRQVDAGEVQSVELAGNEITGSLAGGSRFRTYAPPQYEGLVNRLVERDVAVTAPRSDHKSVGDVVVLLGAHSSDYRVLDLLHAPSAERGATRRCHLARVARNCPRAAKRR